MTLPYMYQEVGRAGRDGKASTCVLLLSKEDAARQQALCYSHSIGVVQILALLRKVLIPVGTTRVDDQSKQTTGTWTSPVQLKQDVCLCCSQLEKELDMSGKRSHRLLTAVTLIVLVLMS